MNVNTKSGPHATLQSDSVSDLPEKMTLAELDQTLVELQLLELVQAWPSRETRYFTVGTKADDQGVIEE